MEESFAKDGVRSLYRNQKLNRFERSGRSPALSISSRLRRIQSLEDARSPGSGMQAHLIYAHR
jgi:hypothetical protein